MKYMFLFCTGPEERHMWNTMSEVDRTEWDNRIGKWFQDNAEVLRDTHQLHGAESTTTVNFEGENPLVTDGPFVETSEIVGGYAVVEVPDHASAVQLAMTWPASGPLEIRPIADQPAA